MKKLTMRSLCITLSVLLLLSLVSCSGGYANDTASGGDSYNGYKAEYDKEYDMEASEIGKPGDAGADYGNTSLGAADAVVDTSRKLIQYVTVNMETTEYDTAISAIKAKCSEVGGYIESSDEVGGGVYSTGSRRATLTFRIPAEKLSEFTGEVENAGNVLSFVTDSKDVTESYYDIEARLASLETQRDRYMALLEKAETMEEILIIDDALTEVLYEIESYTGTLNKYDALVSYSTVTLTLNEVVKITKEEPKDPTFGERIAIAFTDSVELFGEMMQGIAIGFVSMIPFLVIPAIIVVIIIFSITRKRRSKIPPMKMTEKNESEE